MFDLGPLAIGFSALYLLFVIAVAVLVVLGIIALVLSIRLLRICIAASTPTTRGDDGPLPGEG